MITNKRMLNVDVSQAILPFINGVREINTNGVELNKKELKIMKDQIYNHCFNEASKIISDNGDGEQILDSLGSEGSVRSYIFNEFGEKYFELFENESGDIVLDYPHALMMYYKLYSDFMNLKGTPKEIPEGVIKKAMGLTLYLAGHFYLDSIDVIYRTVSRNIIMPSIRESPDSYDYKRCPQLLTKLASSLYTPQGYKTYYFDVDMIATKSTLAYQLDSLEKARSLVKEGLKHGIYFPFLPSEVEERLLKYIQAGEFRSDLMEGYYVPTLVSINDELTQLVDDPKRRNMHNSTVKPIMIEQIGYAYNLINENIKQSGLTSKDVILYHLTSERIAFHVKESIPPIYAFGEASNLMKELETFQVGKLKVEDIFRGVHL